MIDLGKKSETVMVTFEDGKIVDSIVCNGGNCKRKSLGAEPCPGCPYCDEKGNLLCLPSSFLPFSSSLTYARPSRMRSRVIYVTSSTGLPPQP